MKRNGLLLACFTIVLICALVFGYAAIEPRIQSGRQVVSLLIGVFFLFALFELKFAPVRFPTVFLYVLVAVVSTAGWAIVWEFDTEKALAVGAVTTVLSLTSRLWLRAI
jgi:hypothetical protein